MQPIQVFYDAANGQYFIPVQDGNGASSLWHVNLAPAAQQQTTEDDGSSDEGQNERDNEQQ